MTRLSQPVQDLASGAVCAVRAALRQGALVGAALLVATLGAAFLLSAGFLGLRYLLGPGLAALTMGAALLATAAGLLLMARNVGRAVQPIAPANPETTPPVTPAQPADAATLAVFTAAFLLGRRLADRWGSSSNF